MQLLILTALYSATVYRALAFLYSAVHYTAIQRYTLYNLYKSTTLSSGHIPYKENKRKLFQASDLRFDPTHPTHSSCPSKKKTAVRNTVGTALYCPHQLMRVAARQPNGRPGRGGRIPGACMCSFISHFLGAVPWRRLRTGRACCRARSLKYSWFQLCNTTRARQQNCIFTCGGEGVRALFKRKTTYTQHTEDANQRNCVSRSVRAI
jgi:hypothetical protein